MPHILIVDDDQSIRQLLSEIVSIYGYRATAVESAKEAISLMTKQKMDLVLLDLQMPDISGDQFLSFIRKRGFKTPVVVVSAHADPDMARQLGKIGISGIVSKPFEVERVIDVMNDAMGIQV